MARKISESQSLFLDFTRGVSALAVLFGHALGLVESRPALGNVYPIQSYGVVVFFIISGFLIGYNCCIRGESYSFKDYLIDRFSRIYTAFIPIALMIFLIDILISSRITVIPQERLSLITMIANLTMFFQAPINNLIPGFPVAPAFGTASQWWTVAVEWWLYVLFGAMFFAGGSSKGEKAIMAVLAVPAVLVVIVFTAYESLALVWFLSALIGYLFCLTTFESKPKTALVIISFSLLAYLFSFSRLNPNPKVNFYDLNFMMISTVLFFSLFVPLYKYELSQRLKNFFVPPIQWMANISYTLYLSHLTFLALFIGYFGRMSYFGFVVICIICIVFADIFYRLFDRRHRSVRKYLKDAFSEDKILVGAFGDIRTKILAIASIVLFVCVVGVITSRGSVGISAKEDAEGRIRQFVSVRSPEAAKIAFFGAGGIYDPARGIELWKAAARNGVEEARFMLAIHAPEHLPSEENRLSLLRKATENGYPEATLALLEQKDVSISAQKPESIISSVYAQAVAMNASANEVSQERGGRLLLRLAELGDPNSMVMYGQAIRAGRLYQKQPLSVAVMFWHNASDLGNGMADYILAETYLSGGQDVKADRAKAIRHYRLALSRGYPVPEARLKALGIKR